MAASAATKTADDIDDDVDPAIRNLLQCPICVELYQIPASYTPTHTGARTTDADSDPSRGSHVGATPTRTASRRGSRAQKPSASPASPAPTSSDPPSGRLRLPCRMPGCCGQRVCLQCLVRNMDMNANKCPLCNRQGLRSLMRRMAGKETEMMDKVAADALAEWHRLHAGGNARRVDVMEQMRALLQTLAPQEAEATAEPVEDRRARDGALCPPGMIGEEYQEHIAKLRRDDLETELRSLQEMLGSGVLERAAVVDVKRRIAGIIAELNGDVPPVNASAGLSTAPSGLPTAPSGLTDVVGERAGELPLVPEAVVDRPLEATARNDSATSEAATTRSSAAVAQPGSRTSVAKAASVHKQPVMHGQETLLSWARDHADRRRAAVPAKGSAHSSASEHVAVIELHDDWDVIDDAAHRLDGTRERLMKLVLGIGRHMSGKNFDDAEAVVNELAAVADVLRTAHRQRRGASSASADTAAPPNATLANDDTTESPAEAPAAIAPASEHDAHQLADALATRGPVRLLRHAAVGQPAVSETSTSRHSATAEDAHAHAGADAQPLHASATQLTLPNADVATSVVSRVAAGSTNESTLRARAQQSTIPSHDVSLSVTTNVETVGHLPVAVQLRHEQDALPAGLHARNARVGASTADQGSTARTLVDEPLEAVEGTSRELTQYKSPAHQNAPGAGRVRQSSDGQRALSASKHTQAPRDILAGNHGTAHELRHESQGAVHPIVQRETSGERDSRSPRPPHVRSGQISRDSGPRTTATNDNLQSSRRAGDEPPKPSGKDQQPFCSMCLSYHAPAQDAGTEDARGVPSSSLPHTTSSAGLDERAQGRRATPLESASKRPSPPASSQSQSTASVSSAKSWDSSRPSDIQPISHPIDSLRRADAARPAQHPAVATGGMHTHERSGPALSRSSTLHSELVEIDLTDLSGDPGPRADSRRAVGGAAFGRSVSDIGRARPPAASSKPTRQEWLPAPAPSRRAEAPRALDVPLRASAGSKEPRSVSMHDFMPVRKNPRMHAGFRFADPSPSAAKMTNGAPGVVDLVGGDDSDYEGPR